MTTQYDAIYLAPHLDDAALSCGGQIHQKTAVGQRVLIVTVMAGDPPGSNSPARTAESDFIRELHERWELPQNAEAVRREEDEAACRILGADFCHWSVPDCIYRVHPTAGGLLYPTWDDVITAVHPAEAALMQRLGQRMAQLPPAKFVAAPLGIGNHADHLITRQAAEACFGADLWYYEDFPYVREDGALTAVIPPGTDRWQAHTIPLQPADIAVKADAIAAYTSQVSTFFKNRLDLIEQITEYADRVGGERLWRQKTAVDPGAMP